MYKVHLAASGPEAASIASIPSLLLLQGQTVVRFAAPTTEPRWRLHKCFGTSVTVPIVLFYKLNSYSWGLFCVQNIQWTWSIWVAKDINSLEISSWLYWVFTDDNLVNWVCANWLFKFSGLSPSHIVVFLKQFNIFDLPWIAHVLEAFLIITTVNIAGAHWV